MGGSGISWTICKLFAPRARHIAIPAPHHSVFTRWTLFLMPNQQYQSTGSNSREFPDVRGIFLRMKMYNSFTWEEWVKEWEWCHLVWFAGRTQIPSSWRTSPWRCCRSCFGHQSSCVVTTTRLDTTQSEPSATCCDIFRNTLSVLVSEVPLTTCLENLENLERKTPV